MNDFAGVQSLDLPNPDAPVYKDPQQWWYDLTQDQQDQYRAEQVAFLQHVAEVCGVASVSTNANWESPWNPKGINPALWNEYKAKTKV